MVAGRYPRISPSSRFDIAATNIKKVRHFITYNSRSESYHHLITVAIDYT